MKNQSQFSNKISLLILLCFLSSRLISQKTESNLINKFSTEEGLSSNSIYSILQDSKGFIWIATEEGLNKLMEKTSPIFL